MRTRLLRSSLVAAIGVFALVGPLSPSATAATVHPWKSKTPFTQTASSSIDDTISLAGTMAVTIKTTGNEHDGWMLTARAAAKKTTGIGNTTGGLYKATGRSIVTVSIPPGPPVDILFPTTFVLHPPSPCKGNHPPSPCNELSTVSIEVTATVGSDGIVTGITVGHSS